MTATQNISSPLPIMNPMVPGFASTATRVLVNSIQKPIDSFLAGALALITFRQESLFKYVDIRPIPEDSGGVIRLDFGFYPEVNRGLAPEPTPLVPFATMISVMPNISPLEPNPIVYNTEFASSTIEANINNLSLDAKESFVYKFIGSSARVITMHQEQDLITNMVQMAHNIVIPPATPSVANYSSSWGQGDYTSVQAAKMIAKHLLFNKDQSNLIAAAEHEFDMSKSLIGFSNNHYVFTPKASDEVLKGINDYRIFGTNIQFNSLTLNDVISGVGVRDKDLALAGWYCIGIKITSQLSQNLTYKNVGSIITGEYSTGRLIFKKVTVTVLNAEKGSDLDSDGKQKLDEKGNPKTKRVSEFAAANETVTLKKGAKLIIDPPIIDGKRAGIMRVNWMSKQSTKIAPFITAVLADTTLDISQSEVEVPVTIVPQQNVFEMVNGASQSVYSTIANVDWEFNSQTLSPTGRRAPIKSLYQEGTESGSMVTMKFDTTSIKASDTGLKEDGALNVRVMGDTTFWILGPKIAFPCFSPKLDPLSSSTPLDSSNMTSPLGINYRTYLRSTIEGIKANKVSFDSTFKPNAVPELYMAIPVKRSNYFFEKY